MDEIIITAKESVLTLADDGTLSTQQRSLLLSFCDAVASSLLARLRPDAAPEEYGNSLCAAIILGALELYHNADGGAVSRFEAAGVSVQLGSMSGMGERLLAPWLKSDARTDTTAFLGVRS